MAVTLLNPKTGQPQTFDDPNAAAAAFTQGQAAFKRGSQVPIVWRDGSVGTVDPTDVTRAFQDGGTLATERQVRDAKIDAILGPAGKVLEAGQAALIGAQRNASFGLWDKALIEGTRLFAGDKNAEAGRQALQALRERNPVATAGGEIASAIGQAFIPIPGAGAGGAARAGLGIARLAEGGTALARAGEATEAGLGLMRLLPTVDRIGAAAESVARPLGTVGRMVVRGAAENALWSAQNELTEATLNKDYNLTAQKLFSAMGDGALTGAALGGGLSAIGVAGRGALKLAAPKMAEAANALATHGLPVPASVQSEFESLGGRQAFGKMFLKEGVTEGLSTPAAAAEKIQAKAAAKSSALGEQLVNSLDAARVPVRGSDDLISIYTKMSGELQQAERRRFSVVAPYLTEQPKAFGELWNVRTIANDASGEVPALGKFRDAVDAHILDAATAKSAERVPEAKALVEELKRWSVAKAMADALPGSEGAGLGKLGLKMGGALLGGGIMGPVGALKGYAMGIAAEQAKLRAASTAAVALDKLSQLGGIKRAVDTTDLLMNRAAAGAVTPAKGVVAGAEFAPSDAQYQAAKKLSQFFETNPQAFAEQTAARAAQLGAYAPNVQTSYAVQAMRVANYLAANRPTTGIAGAIPGFSATPEAGPLERQKFAWQNEAARNPNAVMRTLAQGWVNPVQLQTLRAVHPDMSAELAALQAQRLAKRAAQADTPDAKEIARFEAITGISLTPSSRPNSLAVSQSIYSGAAPGTPKPTKGKVNVAPPLGRVDRLEKGK